MKRLCPFKHRLLLLGISLLCSAGLHAEPAQISMELHYDVVRHGFTVAKNRQRIVIKDQQYWLESVTRTAGIARWFSDRVISESTHGVIVDQQWQPRLYQHQKLEDNVSSNTIVHFDTERGQITNIRDGHAWTLNTDLPLIDRLSLSMAISHDLSRHQTVSNYWLADGGYPKAITAELGKTVTIDAFNGKQPTLIIKTHLDNAKEPVTMWLALNLDYLPVKSVVHRADGATYTMTLTQRKILP